MAKKQSRQARAAAADFVAHGSERHAQLLGLRKATQEDKLIHKGWTLADSTVFGPTAREDFLETVLVQRVNELVEAPAIPQSKDPRAPDFAPSLQVPPETADGLV